MNIIIYLVILFISLFYLHKDYKRVRKGINIMWSPEILDKKKNTIGTMGSLIIFFIIVFTLIWGGFFWW